MLYAKIFPIAKRIRQINAFSSLTIEGDYMTFSIQPYIAGSNSIKVNVMFGNITEITTDDNNYEQFNLIYSTKIDVSGTDLQNWGVEDEYLLDVIANKIGTSIVEYKTI